MPRIKCPYCSHRYNSSTCACSEEPGSDKTASAAFQSSLMKSHFNTGVLSDVEVTCGQTEYKVHSVILSANSKYFFTQLTGPWKESLEKKIEISDFDPKVVETMLRFMYCFKYSTSTMVFDVQVYQIADKYQFEGLKSYAMRKFEKAIDEGWKTMSADYLQSIPEVYSTTPPDDRGLRDLVVEVSSENIGMLLEMDEFQSVIKSTPDFAIDMVPAVYNRSNKGYRY